MIQKQQLKHCIALKEMNLFLSVARTWRSYPAETKNYRKRKNFSKVAITTDHLGVAKSSTFGRALPRAAIGEEASITTARSSIPIAPITAQIIAQTQVRTTDRITGRTNKTTVITTTPQVNTSQATTLITDPTIEINHLPTNPVAQPHTRHPHGGAGRICPRRSAFQYFGSNRSFLARQLNHAINKYPNRNTNRGSSPTLSTELEANHKQQLHSKQHTTRIITRNHRYSTRINSEIDIPTTYKRPRRFKQGNTRVPRTKSRIKFFSNGLDSRTCHITSVCSTKTRWHTPTYFRRSTDEFCHRISPFQNGNSTNSARYLTARRLGMLNRHKVCISTHTTTSDPTQVLCDNNRRSLCNSKCSFLRHRSGPKNFHKIHQGTVTHLSPNWNKNHSIHRRFSDPGPHIARMPKRDGVCDTPPPTPWICDQLQEIPTVSQSNVDIHWMGDQYRDDDHPLTTRSPPQAAESIGQGDKNDDNDGPRSVTPHGPITISHTGTAPYPDVSRTNATGTHRSPTQEQLRLRDLAHALSRSKNSTRSFAIKSRRLEWPSTPSNTTRSGNALRCVFTAGMGREYHKPNRDPTSEIGLGTRGPCTILPNCKGSVSAIERSNDNYSTDTHFDYGDLGSSPDGRNVRTSPNTGRTPSSIRQHGNGCVSQSNEWYALSAHGINSRIHHEVADNQTNNGPCGAHSGNTQYVGGLRQPTPSRCERLETEPKCVSTSQSDMGTSHNRPVCDGLELPDSAVCRMATRSSSNLDRCVCAPMDFRKRLGEPALDSHSTNSSEVEKRTSHNHTSDSTLAVATLVSAPSRQHNRLAYTPSPHGGLISTEFHSEPRTSGTTQMGANSRMEVLRERYTNNGLSSTVTNRLLRAGKPSTRKVYESKWRTWCNWVHQRHGDPTTPTIPMITDFLTELFEVKKLATDTVAAYRSAISQTVKTDDNQAIGSHPTIIALLESMWQERPRQPKYVDTWNPVIVYDHLQSLNFTSCSLYEVSQALTTYVALQSRRRADCLSKIQFSSIRFTHDQMHFIVDNPKEARGRNNRAVPIACYRHHAGGDLDLSSMVAQYTRLTEIRRATCSEDRLFLTCTKKAHPVTAGTIRSWVRTFLTSAGIDKRFGSHSISAAVTTDKILNGESLEAASEGRWKSTSVMKKHYVFDKEKRQERPMSCTDNEGDSNIH